MSTSVIIREVMENEAVLFGLAVIAVILLFCYLGWVLRRWSWVPRKDARKHYAEYGVHCATERSFGHSPQDAVAVLPDMPTIGSVRHGQKVTICGYEWTIM